MISGARRRVGRRRAWGIGITTMSMLALAAAPRRVVLCHESGLVSIYNSIDERGRDWRVLPGSRAGSVASMPIRPNGRPPFRADHVGSLLRPAALREAFRRHAT